uniref:BZIP domain-containing protein n=1 Tax=Kalanchoe fedtschenkoi TaxID=63787 RepID=A0A7N0TLD9_KALFE
MTSTSLGAKEELGIRHFSQDISQMPEYPPKKSAHRRVHSEIIMLPDDLFFDNDLGIVPGIDGPSFSDDTDEALVSMYRDMDKIHASSATSCQVGGSSQEVAGPDLAPLSAPGESTPQASGGGFAGLTDKPRIRHHHSQSMDGLTSIKQELLMSASEESSSASDSKKAMSAVKLAELALVDPKRAKRIWANRQSAARSKERKMRYIAELERKIQTLQTEATSLTAQLNLLQRDTNGLMAENNELKVHLQRMEQQVLMQDALNEALKEEIQHMKLLTGQAMLNGGPVMNYPYGATQYYPNNQGMHTLMAAQQFQHIQIHAHKQQQQFQQLQHHPPRDQQQHQPLQELHWQPDAIVTGSIPSPPQKESDTDIYPPTDKDSTLPSS